MTHHIEQRTEGHKGAFYIQNNGHVAAELTFTRAGEELLILDHTEVSEELRGTGAGQALVEAAVNWAREQQVKIIALCPFARATFEKHPEWADVKR